MTHGYANTIVRLSKEEENTPEELVSNQYKGKESLVPILNKLLSIVKEFGEDVRVTPKKTEVSLDRKRKFAVIRPATKSRIDLGLKLKGVPCSGRLENSGPFGTMCTHRVRLNDANQVDAQLIEWLKDAYQRAD